MSKTRETNQLSQSKAVFLCPSRELTLQDANVSRPVSLCPVLGKIKILGAFNANLNIINLILII